MCPPPAPAAAGHSAGSGAPPVPSIAIALEHLKLRPSRMPSWSLSEGGTPTAASALVILITQPLCRAGHRGCCQGCCEAVPLMDISLARACEPPLKEQSSPQ